MKRTRWLILLSVAVLVAAVIVVYNKSDKVQDSGGMERQPSQTGTSAVIPGGEQARSVASGALAPRPTNGHHPLSPVQVSGELLRSPHERIARGLIGAALSRADADWLDRQGFPSSSMKAHKAYEGLDLEELHQRAKAGDVHAAIEGASRLYLRSQKVLANSIGGGFDQASDSRKRQIMKDYSDSEDMQRNREFLWMAVVQGSSYAAERMLWSYIGPEGRCYEPLNCDAWTLVAWRMGDWNVQPIPVDARKGLAFEQRSMGNAIRRGNVLWSDINSARAELGIGPLQLNVRPSFKKWQEIHRDPQKEVSIYPR